ncbi:MAG TPA: zf-HC2 domain-containing protein [Cryobacterium sp.]|nr:zf-HC2 domain-containing protein [Cryobacterium sp.]
MSAATDAYSDWDAAYVVGALSPEERREFERHLGGCASCSRAVAGLAGLPGLLAAVPVEQALLIGTPGVGVAEAGTAPGGPDVPQPADAGLRRLLKAARRERNRARALVAGAILAAAAVAATAALLLPGWVGSPAGEPSQAPVAMVPVAPSPLTADIRLAGESWGTRIETSCRYAESGYGADAQAYALYVTDRQGTSSVVATWLAGPGTTVAPVGTTSVALGDIATVDIRSVLTGRVLLEARPTHERQAG